MFWVKLLSWHRHCKVGQGELYAEKGRVKGEGHESRLLSCEAHDMQHLLHVCGPRLLLLLPVGVKLGTADVAVELQLPQAEPKHAAGFQGGVA